MNTLEYSGQSTRGYIYGERYHDTTEKSRKTRSTVSTKSMQVKLRLGTARTINKSFQVKILLDTVSARSAQINLEALKSRTGVTTKSTEEVELLSKIRYPTLAILAQAYCYPRRWPTNIQCAVSQQQDKVPLRNFFLSPKMTFQRHFSKLLEYKLLPPTL